MNDGIADNDRIRFEFPDCFGSGFFI